MANQIVTDREIIVHGRGSLVLPYSAWTPDGDQIDLSSRVLFFEADGVSINLLMEADPADPKGKLLKLDSDDVETLRPKPTRFSVVDRTLAAQKLPFVFWDGVISRTGYVGAPDAVDDE